jgi:DNA-binding NtrC family response regulator
MGRIIGDSVEMQKVFQLLQSALRNDMTVLIQGESGTGKELVAKAIHENGARTDGPFVSINCAAIPRELMESEMFGHEKGAFTGAVARRVGRFEEANGGTLFLDEIGELDPGLQAKLLRVLQEREIQRVGGSNTVPVNVRVVSATKQNLAQRAMSGQFREDLYYRINAFTIHLPALRERHADIPLLANYFFAKHRDSMGRTDVDGLSDEAMAILDRCPWPGNVRQLENAVCRALALTDGPLIELKDMPVEVREGHGPQQMMGETALATGRAMVESLTDLGPMASIRQQAILAALEACEYNVQAAARKLGVSRGTLYRHLPKQFRDGSGGK